MNVTSLLEKATRRAPEPCGSPSAAKELLRGWPAPAPALVSMRQHGEHALTEFLEWAAGKSSNLRQAVDLPNVISYEWKNQDKDFFPGEGRGNKA